MDAIKKNKSDRKIFYTGKTNVGKGLFAKRPIKEGEEILIFTGPIVSCQESDKMDIENFGQILGNGLQVGEGRYIYLEDPGRIANHSCNPNCGIKDDIYLVALRDIKKDEELRYDYSCTMDEDSWTLNCKCEEKDCRKVVGDFKDLPEDLQKKYLKMGIVQKFIAKQYSN